MKRREFMCDSLIGATGLSDLKFSLRKGLAGTPITGGASPSGGPSTAEEDAHTGSVAALSQHFIDPSGNISPWIFIPQDNIKSVSTAEHSGLVTIREAGKGKDIKGVLKDPIRIDHYRMPWAFHLGIVQNQQAMKG